MAVWNIYCRRSYNDMQCKHNSKWRNEERLARYTSFCTIRGMLDTLSKACLVALFVSSLKLKILKIVIQTLSARATWSASIKITKTKIFLKEDKLLSVVFSFFSHNSIFSRQTKMVNKRAYWHDYFTKAVQHFHFWYQTLKIIRSVLNLEIMSLHVNGKQQYMA